MKYIKPVNNYKDLFKSGRFTYINLYNYKIIRKFIPHFDGVYFDGIGLLVIYNLLKRAGLKRYSPDNTSLIPHIVQNFNHFIICGGNQNEADYFRDYLLVGKKCHLAISGYFSNEVLAEKVNDVISTLPENENCVVLLGLGSPKQEQLALKIEVKNNICVLPVGAYISQFYKKPEYFPKLINKFHLRMPYRLVKENLWNRLPNYFISPILFVKDLLR